MPVTISDEMLNSANLKEAEVMRELAVALFQQERITLAQGAAFAGMLQLDFQRLPAARKIPIHYGEAELAEDLERVRRLLLH